MGRRKPGDGAGKPAPSTLPFEEQLTLAREAALRLLSVRERSAMELRSRLRQKGFDREVITSVIDRLQESDLQDDGRFAARFAESAVAKGMAGRRIQAELRARGVGKDLAAEAAVEDPEEELARARDLAVRRAARMEGLPREAVVRRIHGLLARRGFDPDTCSRVAGEVASSPSLDPMVPRDLP
jgi:regulatory protein